MNHPEARPRDFLPSGRELALLIGARAVACLLAWDNGFRALSDDDYARISIAQRYAQAPSFDPSGTSWLPAPFWAYGSAFHLFGPGLGVARAMAVTLGIGATILVYCAARMLGVARPGAVLGAVFSSLLAPYSAYLGIAALPEVPCAALILYSASTLARSNPRVQLLGSLALFLACLSRYEAWPVAATFAIFCVREAIVQRRFAFIGCAALALAAPTIWLTLGRVEHGDALFFVARVTSYRRSLGGAEEPLLRRLLEYPALLFKAADLGSILLVAWAVTRKSSGETLHLRRCALALISLLAFLMVGSVRDGVPTHHMARVLLPIWFFGSILAGSRSALLAARLSGPARAVCGLALLGWTWLVTPIYLPRYDLAERQAELEAGSAARARTARALSIDTRDYGYFAVEAGFGEPAGTRVLEDHDPRRPQAGPFSSSRALAEVLRAQGAQFVILTAEHAALLGSQCVIRWRNAAFLLFECELGER